MSRPSIMRTVPITKSRPKPSAQNSTRKTTPAPRFRGGWCVRVPGNRCGPAPSASLFNTDTVFPEAGQDGERSALLDYRVARLGDQVTQSGHRRIAVAFHDLVPRGDSV